MNSRPHRSAPRWPLLALLLLGVLGLACSQGSGGGETSSATTRPAEVGDGSSDEGTTPAEPPTEPITVVVLGSSTAFGIGPTDIDQSWVSSYSAWLELERPGSTVVNLAVPGFQTASILPSQPDHPQADPDHNIDAALETDPDVLLINMPSNDIVAGVTPEEQMANTRLVVDQAEEAGASVWVTTSQPRNLDEASQREQRRIVDLTFDEFGDRTLDFWTDLADADGAIDAAYDSGDGVHLNDAGHALLVERVIDAGPLDRAE